MAGTDFIVAELARRRDAGLLRQLRTVDGPQSGWIEVGGKRALVLCSNNYLGLADDRRIAEAASRAAFDYGVGSGASRLISGSMRLHQQLEHDLADFKSSERALLFTSGYQANLGAITSLVGREDEVFSDELNHASLIDGCRLSRARITIYRHADVGMLADSLEQSSARRRLIVTDSIFSMDGDVAPLAAICELAERHGAMLLVDEAHATGVIGPQGAGVVAALGLCDRVTLQMGTLGKALGTFGAFVAGSSPVIDLLVNAARSFVFTTALPPPAIAAAREALAIARREEDRRTRLRRNGRYLATGLLRAGFDIPSGAIPTDDSVPGHILPVMLGDAQQTMTMSEDLLARGVFVQGIRPPTVPEGTSRLRATLISTHEQADLDFALDAFAAAKDEAGRHA